MGNGKNGVCQDGNLPSPVEVDEYVVQQVESVETEGGLSKAESFNTDKIRKENLN